MHALLLAALFSAQPQLDTVVRVKLETITLADAERLDDKVVVATFTVASAYTWGAGKNLCTVVGPVGGTMGVERSAVLKGNRLHHADQGAKLTVVGTLRVIRHLESTIGFKTFSGFTEIRIEEP
jgi:hypothetical protein